jgi:hypothetical protein
MSTVFVYTSSYSRPLLIYGLSRVGCLVLGPRQHLHMRFALFEKLINMRAQLQVVHTHPDFRENGLPLSWAWRQGGEGGPHCANLSTRSEALACLYCLQVALQVTTRPYLGSRWRWWQETCLANEECGCPLKDARRRNVLPRTPVTEVYQGLSAFSTV